MTGTATFESTGRQLGASTGLRVGLLFAVIETISQIGAEPVAAFLIVGLPTILAGGLGGRKLGPRALEAVTGRAQAAVILRLGVLAVMIGAPLVSTAFSIVMAFGRAPDTLPNIFEIIAAAGMFTAFGFFLVGPFALIGTSIAAWIWIWLLRRQARSVPRVGLPSRVPTS
ncbi:MAG TPA: hypothetical protein VM451_08115 [Candidatus Limnocylindria bacterium]|nr:hypothetical protein [Candidatus Limnocylindria bacterium]